MRDSLKDSIIAHEGIELKVYLDSLGFKTVGIGHKITKYENLFLGDEITEPEMNRLFEGDLEIAENRARTVTRNYVALHETAQDILIEMVFQMGATGVKNFRNMVAALEEKPPNYREAALEMLDSKWALQTTRRAKEMAEKMGLINA